MTKQINPNVTTVTTLSYDMDSSKDNNISTEIKDYLVSNLGWHKDIIELTVKQLQMNDTQAYHEDMPASTLWKVQVTPEEAISEFITACDAYNATHASDLPKPKFAHGKAFAICNALYDAVEIK